ncbi:MAG: HlyC/CorC family transporter [Chloroflexi bacterium]|nr:HlyC/CorC family transporter [Chloroflexota bacterium]
MVYVILLIFFLMLSAFFSGSEAALISLQRIRLEHMLSTRVPGAKRVYRLLDRPERLLSTILLGNNFVNTAAASLATLLAVSIWGERGVIYATIVVTVLLLIFGETTPKTIGVQRSERVSLAVARPIELLSLLLSPLVFILSWLSCRITRLVGGTPLPRSLTSEEEIRTMISVGHKEGTVKTEAAEMLHNVFEFGNRPVREVIVPRPDVVAIEQGAKISDFLTIYAEHPLSHFPVYQENMDNVVGIVSAADVLMALAKNNITRDSSIDDMVRPAYFAPESKRIGELFAEMRKHNYHMAIIVDEYGGTVGITGLRMLVEEIVGEVGDELAGMEKDYEVINEYTFQIDGSMRVDEANEEMGLQLPESDEYETVAGFVLHLLGHIPKRGEPLKYKGLKLVITKMKGVKIEEILVTREKEGERQEKHAATATEVQPGR